MRILLFICLCSIAVLSSVSGILVSQIGYDPALPMQFAARSDDSAYIVPGSTFNLVDSAGGRVVLTGPVRYDGFQWKCHWWTGDFSAAGTPGRYRIRILNSAGTANDSSDDFLIGKGILWDQTWQRVSLQQLDERARIALNGLGWQDCGTPLREASSHATTLVGLCDLLEFTGARLPDSARTRLLWHVKHGAEYLAFSQDSAKRMGLGDGPVLHEIQNHRYIVTGDVAKAALVLARAARLLTPTEPTASADFLGRAEKAFQWIAWNGPVFQPASFNPCADCGSGGDCLLCFTFANGAPDGFVPARTEWKSCDLLMMCGAALELYKAGKPELKDSALAYARRVMARQISTDRAEYGLYGHFRAFESASFSEKSWTHHDFGFDVGSTFPHYLIPLIEMAGLFKEHPEAPLWRQTVQDFTTGYLLPACSTNPFHLLPAGCFPGQGVLHFSGLWHGMNGAYASTAALACDLRRFLKEPGLDTLIAGNLNWIAGLNSGFVENNRALPYSMIYGAGERFRGSWTRIPGSICNGFDADPQFAITEPKAVSDGPNYFTDEDWITHGGAWLSALSRVYADSAPWISADRSPAKASPVMMAAYPNPFVRAATLYYSTQGMKGTAAIFQVDGKEVFRQSVSGQGRLIWNAGSRPPGFYICRLTAGKRSLSRTLVLTD